MADTALFILGTAPTFAGNSNALDLDGGPLREFVCLQNVARIFSCADKSIWRGEAIVTPSANGRHSLAERRRGQRP